LGFANREGKQFAGTNLTGMTVDQAIDFARVGGPYANYSKTQTPDGHVATPMGEYQIVGTTLAQAKRDMGLTGDELMTAELQERIAHHLYDNYGEKPWAASAPTGGLDTNISTMSTPNQQYEGGVKPYEDRNWLGQIFHNPDAKGSMNKDAMLSLLSGVGTMLASPSPFFLPTLGAGLAGAANTYMAREGQRSDITAQNIENTKKMQTAYMQFKELNPDSPMTIGQFAESHGWTQNSPYESKATGNTDVTSSLPLYKGVAPVNLYGTGGNTPLSIVDEKGVPHNVPANQTYGYLTQWRNLLTSKAGFEFPGATAQIQAIDQKIADIVANQGEITAPDGSRILDPSYAQIQDSANTRQIKYKVGTELALGLQDRTDAYQRDKSNFDQLANAYGELVKSGTTQGPLTQFFAKAGSALGQLGIPFDPNTQNGWAQIQVINKKIAQDLASQGVQLTDTVTEYLGAAQPTPDLQRAAIAEILAAKAALLAREKQAITGMQGAGADAVEVWNANNAAVNRPVDTASQQDTFNTLMQIGQEPAPPAPSAHEENDTLVFHDDENNRSIVGSWHINGPNGPAYYGPDGTYLGTE
jgi:ribosomal protein S16